MVSDVWKTPNRAAVLDDNMFCPSFGCFGSLSLNTKMGALFACMFRLVTNHQEVICTQCYGNIYSIIYRWSFQIYILNCREDTSECQCTKSRFISAEGKEHKE